ncbi:tripartite tricarboxylate transporter permease [Bosea sp. BK604]|uniref:tripartite tricarboxylate transporter permease n=1 Tax=Bosea sp. BK604 TaxID=2512180 RepID=UPI00104E3698|nr:tripartite tricarboxylate transporter permease [Bosea sp. BK604]TCR61788.1 putative tricarboxylic transport membrane protein [Bosea sp. BK604]
MEHLISGFAVALQWDNLIYTFIGVFIGTIVGVLPGIGPSASIALLVPITFGMNPTSALIMMSGIYYGAMYGGSISSILINTPGEASSVMTAIDGYQMAKKGRAGAALAVAAWGSFIAGTIGIVALSLLAVPLAQFALEFGPAEYFLVMLFSMAAVSALAGDAPGKAVFSMMLGLAVATVGIDMQTGQERFTFAIPEFQDGIHFVAVVVGLFAVAEVLRGVEDWYMGTNEVIRIKGKLMLTRDEWKRSIKPIARGGIIGFLLGVLPGAGTTIATFLSYAAEKKSSKHPEEFGHGAIEGVAGPESANNAATMGAMVPLLSLGLPGSSTTAVLLGVLIMYGIQPGPTLFTAKPELVWGLINSMYVGNIMLLILNLPLIGLFVRLVYLPVGLLLPIILALSVMGAYGLNSSVIDLYVMLFFGVAGYLLEKIKVPLGPMVLALVLGGTLEQSFRQAMTISSGSPKIFVGTPICVVLLIMCIGAISWPFISKVMARRTAASTPKRAIENQVGETL